MTAPLSCEALRDDIIALLYDDGEVAERSRAREHLALCVPCRTEYAGLKGVRKTLGGWTLPATAQVAQTPPWFRRIPAPLAAAAGILLGIGIAIAGLSLSPAPDAQQGAAPASTASTGNFVSHDELQEILQAQENRHQSELSQIRQTLTQVAEVGAPMSPASNSSNLKTVSTLSPSTLERLLKASEERQARMFEARLAGLRTEADLQRQYDMAQIAAGLAYIDSRTGADAARTSELMKNLVRVTAKPQDR